MNIDNVLRELYTYFCENRWLKILLPLAEPMVLVVSALIALNFFVSLGFLASLLTYLLYLGVLLTLSKMQFKVAAIGLGVRAAVYALSFLGAIFTRYRYFNYSALIGLAIYGFFAYMAFKKSMAFSK